MAGTWPKVDRRAVALDYETGLYNYVELAEIHGCTKQRIEQIVRDCVPRETRRRIRAALRFRGRNGLSNEAIAALRRQGLGVGEIMKSRGLTRGQIAGALRRAELGKWETN